MTYKQSLSYRSADRLTTARPDEEETSYVRTVPPDCSSFTLSEYLFAEQLYQLQDTDDLTLGTSISDITDLDASFTSLIV